MGSSIITSRVKEDVKKKLEEECELKNITLNTLIGQILSKHVDWDRFAENIGFTFTSKVAIKAFLELLSEEQIEKITHNQCKDAMKSSIDFIQGEFNFESFIKTLDQWIGSSNIPFRHITTKDSEKFVIQHDMGKNWSLYIVSLAEATSWDLNYGIGKKIIGEQSVSFEIKKVN